MQQTVLMDHNFDPAIKSLKNLSNINPAFMFFTSAMQNLIPTSWTFNINADAIKPTEAIKLTIAKFTVTVTSTKATKPVNATSEKKKTTLD